MHDQSPHHAAKTHWEPPALNAVPLAGQAAGEPAAAAAPDAPPSSRHTIKSISPEGYLTGWM
jgi:hypothetical protein